jgi:hypothetical protein
MHKKFTLSTKMLKKSPKSTNKSININPKSKDSNKISNILINLLIMDLQYKINPLLITAIATNLMLN